VFGSGAPFLVEGLELTLNFHGDDAVTGEVPVHVKLRVAEAAPTMKGETAAPSYKRAVMEGGVEVQVPPFVQTGDVIVVNTEERSFVRRADKE
jgi:elongation factor P